MTTAPTELKPCPFCGGKAALKYAPGFGWEQPPDKSLASISCGGCGTFREYVETEKAIAAWNTRAPAALEPQAVDDAMVERAIDAVMDADRYAPKIVPMGANPPLFDGMQIDHDGPWVSRVTVAKLLRAALQAAKEPSHD